MLRVIRTCATLLMAACIAPVSAAIAAATPADDVASSAAKAPDYADPASWAAGPQGLGAAAALPAGATPASRAPDVAVFFVHPTTQRSQTQWNQDVADAKANKWVDLSSIARQASVFSACCDVWAPRYRAATYRAFVDEGHRTAAFALAYSDVERAFDWFLKHGARGRPFIIAGHSQGAKHISDLLEKRIDGTSLQKRLVAAYIIGINVAEGEFGRRIHHVPICDEPAQTGCALQWNTIEAGANLDPVVKAYQKTYIDAYGDVSGRQTLCVNPVTFDRSKPVSLSADAKGAVPGEPDAAPMQPLRPHAVAVRCERGVAIAYMAPGLDTKPLPGGSLHYYDVGLFYADIRANALLRSQAWYKANRKQ